MKKNDTNDNLTKTLTNLFETPYGTQLRLGREAKQAKQAKLVKFILDNENDKWDKALALVELEAISNLSPFACNYLTAQCE